MMEKTVKSILLLTDETPAHKVHDSKSCYSSLCIVLMHISGFTNVTELL